MDPAIRDGALEHLDLGKWHPSSWVRPAVEFTVILGLWLALVAVGLWHGHWILQALLVLPLALLSGHMFTLGHDSGHGSLSSSRGLNGVVGRLALVPSMHVFGLWRFHHDIHHRYTNLRSHDFVWTPTTVAEYRQLCWWRRALHRLYRNRSGFGLGFHYSVEIWAPRMLWPRTYGDLRRRREFVADTTCLYSGLAALAAAAWIFMMLVDPGRAGDLRSWVSALVFLFVLPLLCTHWLIGFVIYLNHTHPNVEWYEDPREWSQHRAQVEGSVAQHYGRFRYLPIPQRILNHTAHHVDPGVPLGELGAAQKHLVEELGDRVVSMEWTPKSFGVLLSSCKLYDYESKQWLTYQAVKQRS